MGGQAGDGAGDRERVEELLRTNATLAAELRSLALGRTDAPRRGAMPTSRRLALLHDERDTFAAELEAARAELASTQSTLADMTTHARRLELHKGELEAEVTRLRAGLPGILRRLRARLLRQRG